MKDDEKDKDNEKKKGDEQSQAETQDGGDPPPTDPGDVNTPGRGGG